MFIYIFYLPNFFLGPIPLLPTHHIAILLKAYATLETLDLVCSHPPQCLIHSVRQCLAHAKLKVFKGDSVYSDDAI